MRPIVASTPPVRLLPASANAEQTYPWDHGSGDHMSQLVASLDPMQRRQQSILVLATFGQRTPRRSLCPHASSCIRGCSTTSPASPRATRYPFLPDHSLSMTRHNPQGDGMNVLWAVL